MSNIGLKKRIIYIGLHIGVQDLQKLGTTGTVLDYTLIYTLNLKYFDFGSTAFQHFYNLFFTHILNWNLCDFFMTSFLLTMLYNISNCKHASTDHTDYTSFVCTGAVCMSTSINLFCICSMIYLRLMRLLPNPHSTITTILSSNFRF